MKKLLQLFSIIILPLSLIIMWGYGPGKKAKKQPDLTTQLDSAIKIQTKLQILAILQQDSLDKFTNVSIDIAFMKRHIDLQISLFRKEKEVELLIKKELLSNDLLSTKGE